MAKVTICGASDDLIEIDGDLTDEFNPSNDDPSYLAFSDGTVLRVQYDGFWRVVRLRTGTAGFEKHEGTDMDTDYTDKVTLTGDLLWVVFGNRLEKIEKGRK